MRKRRRTVFDDGWFMRALSSISYGVSGMAATRSRSALPAGTWTAGKHCLTHGHVVPRPTGRRAGACCPRPPLGMAATPARSRLSPKCREPDQVSALHWTFAGSAAGLSEWRKREIARIPRGRSELIFDSQICNSSKMFLRLRRPKPDIDGTEIARCSDLVCAIVWAQQRGRQHLFPTEREEFHHA